MLAMPCERDRCSSPARVEIKVLHGLGTRGSHGAHGLPVEGGGYIWVYTYRPPTVLGSKNDEQTVRTLRTTGEGLPPSHPLTRPTVKAHSDNTHLI